MSRRTSLMFMILVRWFLSKTVRQAVDFRRRVWALLNEQRDLLSDDAIQAVQEALAQLQQSIHSGASKAELHKRMDHLEKAVNRRLRPYPFAALRENVKEVLVAVTLILSLTTFFLQLTKIPTGSLQPTLYGITYYNLKTEPSPTLPNFWKRVADYWIKGISYFDVVAQSDGQLNDIEPPRAIFPFIKKQRFQIGDSWQTVWFPPEDLFNHAGLHFHQYFHRGDTVLKMKVIAGDHLLVDRFTYNFRRPRRGEIFVFKTSGIPKVTPDVLYIKRLVGLPGDRVQINDKQHLVINGHELDASTPHFENVYTFGPVPQINHYFGHVNERTAERWGLPGLAPLFPDAQTVHVVAPGHYLAMGDNTLHSFDSRAWGDVPQANITGKAWFVYWPITKRFGWRTW